MNTCDEQLAMLCKLCNDTVSVRKTDYGYCINTDGEYLCVFSAEEALVVVFCAILRCLGNWSAL